ncbi:hypothetical protein LTR85_006549 [Meristemomyces frigidus]|nr:hypothetical protein LTR85_006549 [Meristemomyces frigidus]
MAPPTGDTGTTDLAEDIEKLSLGTTRTSKLATDKKTVEAEDSDTEEVVFTGRKGTAGSKPQTAPTATPTTTDQRYIPPQQRGKASRKSKSTTATDKPSSTRILSSGTLSSNSVPSAFNASAPAFTPVNVPRVIAQQPVKSVSAKELNRRHGVDKHSRYGQPSQPQVSANGFNPILFDPAYFDQYMPPTENLKQLMPGWYKQTRAGKQTQTKGSKAQLPVTQAHLGLPMRTPPPSPKSASGKLLLLKRPVPTRAYLKQASQDPLTLDQPRPLLVVLDLNGTLLYRKQRGGSTFVERPRLKEFLYYLLSHHRVMVWSSARPGNVEPMCAKLFTAEQRKNLVAVWGRDKLRLSTDHYNQKVQVYKQLSWIWSDHIIASSCAGSEREWSQENTVLIDDSVEKAASEPHNIIKIDEFEAKPEQMECDVLGHVVKYLDTLRWERDVSAFIRRKPFVYEEGAEDYDWMPTVNDMH